MQVEEENFARLARIDRELVGKVEALASRQAGPDMDSTKNTVFGEQENSAHHGHLESTSHHPLLYFKRGCDFLRTRSGLAPGAGHSAEDW